MLNKPPQYARIAGWLIGCCGLWACCLAPGWLPTAKGQELTAAKVRSAIQRGVDFLFRQQQANGSWSDDSLIDVQYKGGPTALVTLALLNCGVAPEDPRIDKALDYLDAIDIGNASTYTVALLSMTYSLADPDRYAGRIRECVQRLVEIQTAPGGWSYPGRSIGDGSNAQFALLGLHEGRLAGIEVDDRVWKDARKFWNQLRAPDGSYYYSATSRQAFSPTGSMTAAGISSLVIIDENLAGSDIVTAAGDIDCCADDDWLIQVDQAADWLGKYFTVSHNPSAGAGSTFRNSTFYYLYALERAGRLTGQRFFGEHDWYREGAEYLLNVRKASGYWIGTSQHGERNRDIATAFALLFLSKGRRPVVIGKYQHSATNDWDRHRKGVHFLTRSMEAAWKTKLNWQSINGKVASTEELLETPVLFFSGRDSLDLDDRQKARLKEYIEYGRFVFAEANQGEGCTPDGEPSEFDRQFRALMKELFPESELQVLPPTHPVWTAHHRLQPDPQRPVLGIQTSCRTAVIYVPANLSCYWQANRRGIREQLNAESLAKVDYCVQLGVNVVSYATGKEVSDRLDGPQLVASDAGSSARELLIPKLIHGGGADVAPNAWSNVLRQARVDLKQPFRAEQFLVEITPDTLAEFPMVFMHGRDSFSFTPQERQTLRDYLQDGFLFADAICASRKFAESFRNEMQAIFPEPEIELQRLPPEHVLFTQQLGGYDLQSVTIRRPAPGGATSRQTIPQLEGLVIDGRLAVIFSPYDLSCAMENASASTCEGYTREDAARIGVNILLYVLNQ